MCLCVCVYMCVCVWMRTCSQTVMTLILCMFFQTVKIVCVYVCVHVCVCVCLCVRARVLSNCHDSEFVHVFTNS